LESIHTMNTVIYFFKFQREINEKNLDMVLEIIFILGLGAGVISSRSVTIRNKITGGHFFMMFPSTSMTNFASILTFIGMLSIFAISICGFILFKWYFVIVVWMGAGAICRFFIEKKFNFPFEDITTLYYDVVTIVANAILWTVFFLN